MLDTGFAGMQLTSDGRRTDVTGVLVNRGDVALDVTIHVVARDHRDNIIANELVGTFPNVPTSMVITLRHTLDLAPVKSAEFLVIKAERSAPP